METIYQPKFRKDKFEELLLLVAKRSADDPNFGKTKLNKIFYFVDFLAYGMFGEPVTGATYQRRPYGPVPQEISTVRNGLLRSGSATIERVPSFNFVQERLIALREPDVEVFDSGEIALIEEVLQGLREHNAVGASELSHRELGWRAVGDRETIPYETVFLSCRDLSSDDIKRGQELWQEYSATAA